MQFENIKLSSVWKNVFSNYMYHFLFCHMIYSSIGWQQGFIIINRKAKKLLQLKILFLFLRIFYSINKLSMLLSEGIFNFVILSFYFITNNILRLSICIFEIWWNDISSNSLWTALTHFSFPGMWLRQSWTQGDILSRIQHS